jgi:hypothetical protein
VLGWWMSVNGHLTKVLVFAALHANRNTPTNTTMLQLLKAGSVVGAACPNPKASLVALRDDLGKL